MKTQAYIQDNLVDEQQIKQIVASVEKAHNQKVPEAFAQIFAQDAVFVNAAGVRLFGRDQIFEATKNVMDGFMANSYARYEVSNIKFIRHDVAIVSILQHPITKEGETLEGEVKGTPTYVMTKEEGKWVVVAGQNTLVQ